MLCPGADRGCPASLPLWGVKYKGDDVYAVVLFFFFQKSYSNISSVCPRIRFQAGDHGASHFHLLSTNCMHLQQHKKMYTNDKLQCSQWCRHIFIYILSEGEVRQGDWIIWQRKQGWEVWSWEWDSVLFHFRVWLSDHVVSCKKDQVKIMFLFSLSWLSSDSLTVG